MAACLRAQRFSSCCRYLVRERVRVGVGVGVRVRVRVKGER